MAKLSVKLQKPTIELPVKAKDAAGEVDTIKVGFKRYEQKDSQAKLKKLQEILKAEEENEELTTEQLDRAIAEEIVYIKDVNLELEDDNNKVKKVHIADTRTATPIPTLWETSEECLAVLTELYLASSPYRVGLLSASMKALVNSDFASGEIKN